ncbi:DUF1631 family protein [Dokdonella sp.]|uniref:DUF1631 family protein n=1 Tax=Dokdonella sp. TaxID=2291710 RepID=UPI001B02D7D4|nr:DUF1631 family protein [Dokdonella sp.]MBO9664314.1 DUF1631 domain-containing protein [Dokdonella sp.]
MGFRPAAPARAPPQGRRTIRDHGATHASLARRADLPPRVRAVLDELLSTTYAHFGAALQQTLDELDRNLFKLAEHAVSNGQQQTLFESLGELRRNRAEIVPRFLQHVESTLARIRGGKTPAAATPAPTTTLELVDPSALEEELAQREVAGKSEIRNSQALYALAHRFGVLAAAPAWPHETLPLGPAQLIAAFRHALDGIDLGVERRVLAYRTFDRVALATLGRYYDAIHAHLVAHRILPNLHWSAQRARPASTPMPAQTSSAAEASPVPAASAPSMWANAGAADDVELFGTLYRLLAERRRREGGHAAAPSAVPASRADLQILLGVLQRERRAPDSTSAEPGYDNAQFKRELFDRLRKAGPHGGALRLQDEDSDTIDLVGLLFEYIGTNLRANSGARALLDRLHVPVLRVALGDRSFFTQRSHPARELLNTIAETGERWIDESDSDPDLSAKMRLVVDSVSADYDGDPALFGNLLADLSGHMQLLARRAEVFERRQIEAAQGRERIEIARATARGAVAQALQHGTPAPAVRTLLEQAWTDALALSALRHGSGSDEFRRRLAVAAALVRGDAAKTIDDSVRQELEAGLAEIGLPADDVAGVLAGLAPEPAATTADASPDRPRVEEVLRGRARFGEPAAPAATTEPATKPQPIPLNATELATLERLREVPFGTWFVFTLNQQGASVRRKLAWFSTVTKRCLFVNQRGARCEDRTLDQLARDLVRGQARIEIPPQTSLIDRAWKAILDTLSKPDASAADRSEREAP